uniref:Uncharacterized protein n=1 Tax=Rhizophora mucronata TaxID=61149 RepID=A0A2P2QYT2_RHIMU
MSKLFYLRTQPTSSILIISDNS